MSEDRKGKRDRKSDYFFPPHSSDSSCSSETTNRTTLESESTPADSVHFVFPVAFPPVGRQSPQAQQSEPQADIAGPSTFICSHCKNPQCPSLSADDTPPDRSCAVAPSKQVESKCSSALGAIQKQLKTFTTRKEEKKCLLESDSSEQISERVPSQQVAEAILVDVGEKPRSSSLPIHSVPVDIPQKRTQSDGAVQTSRTPTKHESPKKKSPLKRAVAMLRQVVTRSKPHQDTQAEKQSDSIQELEECGTEKKRTEESEVGVAEAAAQSAETVQESERPNEPEEIPQTSRRQSNLGDESSESPAKRRLRDETNQKK